MTVSTIRNLKFSAEALLIHPTAQRAVNHMHVKRLAEKLDLDAIGTIHAVDYMINGKKGPWIVDGQHRVLALIEAGCGEWPVDVMIHTEVKDDKRASELFLNLNRRLIVHPLDKFMNELRSGQEEAVGINDIVLANGLKLAISPGEHALSCITSLRNSYRYDAGKSLMATLKVLNNSWGKQATAHEGKLVEGICITIAQNREQIDVDHLTLRLSKYPGGPSALIGSARGRMQYSSKTLAKSLAVVVVDLYNSGRKAGKIEVL